jgi:hypothetical protein
VFADARSVGREIQSLHGEGGLLALAPPLLRANGVQREMPRGVVEPAAEDLRRANGRSLLRQRGENILGDFFREMRIEHHASRSAKDHRQMPLDELAESVVRAALDESTK